MPMMASAFLTNPSLNEEFGRSAIDMKNRTAVSIVVIKNVFIRFLLSNLTAEAPEDAEKRKFKTSSSVLCGEYYFGKSFRLRRSLSQIEKIDLLGAFGRRKAKHLLCQLRRQVPVSY